VDASASKTFSTKFPNKVISYFTKYQNLIYSVKWH